MALSPYEQVTSALEARGSKRRRSDWQCLSHEDDDPSLSVAAGRDGLALLRCLAGCDTRDVVAALGLEMRDLFPDSGRLTDRTEVACYEYTDEDGEALFQVVRFHPKDFRQRRPDGVWSLNGVRRVPYHLPAVIAAVREGRTVYVVEGERDVHAIERAGGVATTNPGGAGKWRGDYSTFMGNTNVIIVADKDEPGRRHAAQVARSLEGIAASVRLVEATEGKDSADHLAAGYGLDDFVPLVEDSTSHTTEPSQRLRLVRATDVRSEPVAWLRDGVPVGNVTLLAGPPGLAKTTLLCEWGARTSRGQLPGAFHDRPMNVVLMSGEDSIENTLKPRCEAAGADLDRVHFVVVGDEGLAIPDDLDRLGAALAGLGSVALLGIDPLMAFVADRIDSHKDHHIRRAFAAIRRFAHHHDLAAVVIAHLNKSDSQDFLTRIGGSVGIGAAVRSALAVVQHPDDPNGPDRALVHVKSNLGPFMPTERFRVESRTTFAHDGREISTSGIAWLGTDDRLTRSNVLETPERRSDQDEAEDLLISLGLPIAALPVADVRRAAKELGIGDKTLQRARGGLGIPAWREAFDSPWMWGTRPTGHAQGLPVVQLGNTPSDVRKQATDSPNWTSGRTGVGLSRQTTLRGY